MDDDRVPLVSDDEEELDDVDADDEEEAEEDGISCRECGTSSFRTLTKVNESDVEEKALDWVCTECNTVNDPDESRCLKCGEGRKAAPGGPLGWGGLYRSTRLVDYGICEECYEQNHKHLTLAGAFVVLEEGQWNEYMGKLGSMRKNCWCWEELRSTCNRDSERNKELQNLSFLFDEKDERPAEEDIQEIKGFIANSINLKVFYIDLSSPEQELEASIQPFTALFEGIAGSQSILSLYIILNFTWTSAIEGICNVIRNNKSIRYMVLLHRTRDTLSTEDQVEALLLNPRTYYLTLEQREQYVRAQQLERKNRAKASAVLLFQALADGASMRSFVCHGIKELGEDCRAAAIAAMEDRPSLKSIKANFQVQNEELEQLMQDKKDGNESRVGLLDELLSCKQVEEEDQVAALFHFVRSNPGSLPELLDVGSD